MKKMIYTIKDLFDPRAGYLKDDPVRPHIPLEQRFGTNKHVIVLTDEENVQAVVCTKLCKGIPSNEEELLFDSLEEPDTIVFYTIWSYKPGAGQKLIRASLDYVKAQMPNVKRFVTLSPQTEMAKRFHTKNGAHVFRINFDTVNYEYI